MIEISRGISLDKLNDHLALIPYMQVFLHL
jgi:hypothetical protein